MAIPDFVTGGILPTGIHDCDLIEIEATLVYNDGREVIWSNFLNFVFQLLAIPEIDVIYVDGSFTTDKETYYSSLPPSDVDIVVEFLDVGAKRNLEAQFPDLFFRSQVKSSYLIDLLTCFAFPVSPAGTMVDFFQELRVEDAGYRGLHSSAKKGILRISLEQERKRLGNLIYDICLLVSLVKN